jgi:hypothetical protein
MQGYMNVNLINLYTKARGSWETKFKSTAARYCACYLTFRFLNTRIWGEKLISDWSMLKSSERLSTA